MVKPAAVCMMVDKINRYINEALTDRKALESLLETYQQHFRSGLPLVDIARELQKLGIATASDVEYVANLPPSIHDEIQARIGEIIERDPRWNVVFAHEPADEFAVRVDEDAEGCVATVWLLGPHHDATSA